MVVIKQIVISLIRIIIVSSMLKWWIVGKNVWTGKSRPSTLLKAGIILS